MKKNLLFSLTVGLVFGLLIVSSANAAFIDDFEDGNIDGWNVTSSSGGSNGVEFINDSNWAFVHNYKSGQHSLSMEFDYQPDSLVSFDIQASASTGRGNYGETYHTASGVAVFFENSFNLALGEVSFVYATSTTMLPSNGYSISTTPQYFEGLMSEWADLALVDAGANIASIGLEFWAIGRTAQIPQGSAGVSHVRFDNVAVDAVPVPGAVWLLGSGLIGLVGLRRKKQS